MNEAVSNICCFTGHRNIPAAHLPALSGQLDRVLTTLIGAGITVFRTGGARGFDTLAALKVLEWRDRDPRVRLELILPCRNQTKGWEDFDRDAYGYVLEHADSVTVLHEHYQNGCMFERNRALVQGSLFCVAYCTSSAGGSAYTLNFARSEGCRVVNLADLI